MVILTLITKTQFDLNNNNNNNNKLLNIIIIL